MTTEKEKAKARKIDLIYKQKIRELTELAQRTQANFENFRKQTEKRVEDIKKLASRTVITDLLPVVDNFALALNNVDLEKPQLFVEGVELIYSQLNTLLHDTGVIPIKTQDMFFDPHLHEALMKVPSDRKENFILEEFQKGYTLHGTVIRTARVKISAGKKQSVPVQKDDNLKGDIVDGVQENKGVGVQENKEGESLKEMEDESLKEMEDESLKEVDV